MALDHKANNGLITRGNLVRNIGHDANLSFMLFLRISMTTVDHHISGNTIFEKLLLAFRNTCGIKVSFPATTAQHDMRMAITPGMNNGNFAFMVDAQKSVGR